MRLKNLNIDKETPIFLAPMAGVTDLTFRQICAELGADVTCTEMISAKALSYNNKKTFDLMKKYDGETPAAIQLFGSDPGLMAEMAQRVEPEFDIIDVNMGCPVNKVVGNNEGSALMKNPLLAEKIVSKMAGVLVKPLTVKIRSGFDKDHINAAEFAKRLEGAGASAIAVHARTREQIYHGSADPEIIRQVKEAVGIPVIGNGDIFSGEDAVRMKEKTGADAVMIARGAQGDPWIFARVRSALDKKATPRETSINRMKTIIRHAQGLVRDKGESVGIREMRKHLSWYTAGMKDSAEFRRKTNYIVSLKELIEITEVFFNG